MSNVDDLMVSVSKFPTISQEATLREAILTLDRVWEEYASGQREQRILLVFDHENSIVGKLTPKDVIRGLERSFGNLRGVPAAAAQANPLLDTYRYVMNSPSLRELRERTETPWDDLCSRTRDTRIKDFLTTPPSSQVIEAGDSLNKALHRFIVSGHNSLFVTKDKKLVGVLRFTDTYRELLDRVKHVCCA